MNETKRAITSIIRGNAILALFFTIGAVTNYIALGLPIYEPETNYPIHGLIGIISILAGAIGMFITYVAFKHFSIGRDSTCVCAIDYLRLSVLLYIFNIPLQIFTTFSISGIYSYGDNVGYLLMISFIGIALIGISNAMGYSRLGKSQSLNHAQKRGVRMAWLSAIVCISTVVLLALWVFSPYQIRGALIDFIIYPVALLYVTHWVLFFVGWSKVRASFAETPNAQ